MKKYIIAITGFLCSGKTTASKILQDFAVDILDLDHVSHQLTDNCPSVLMSVMEAFGREYIFDGKVDRIKLRDLVFSNDDCLLTLERIIYPHLVKHVQDYITNSSSNMIILLAPLLLKVYAIFSMCNSIIFIDCKSTILIDRAVNRIGCSIDYVTKMLNKNCDRELYMENADYIITNNSSIEDFKEQLLYTMSLCGMMI